jgi:hypothetical protein
VIGRYSSRRGPLGDFLPSRLRGARAYDRIAGFFRSSILEIAGEALDEMAEGAVARVVCNSQLDPRDVETARAAKQAMNREWREGIPEDVSPPLQKRLARLYRFLCSGRLQVRVLADEHFGLVHGKAGVITRADGGRECFLGSANESLTAWQMNYELVWTDDSAEGVGWVAEEFEALWLHPAAVDLAEAVVQEIGRLSQRVVLPDVRRWKEETGGEAAPAAVELPLYRRENGLWAHQKYFIRRAFEEHKRWGVRLLLADQVGLGKTVQLALTAKLMALWDEGPILVLAPKALLLQWQDELWNQLQLPSAVWTGRQWVDEQGIPYPDRGIEELRRCPRRVGIVSTGLIVQGMEAPEILKRQRYLCVILDEAHHARRTNLGPRRRNEQAQANNLMAFMREIAPKCRSLLLATATPVQLDPIEAFDLLEILNTGSERVLGSRFDHWITEPRVGLDYILGRHTPPESLPEAWEWIRDPLPPGDEGRDFQVLRSELGLGDDKTWAKAADLDRLRPLTKQRLRDVTRVFFRRHHPYIRHIVRRTREYLEEHLDPETNEPYLKPVRVRLFGERPEEAVPLPGFLQDAYEAAEKFCDLLGMRPGLNSGILKTILLRRVGSTIKAGRETARTLLGEGTELGDAEADEQRGTSRLRPFSKDERDELQRFARLLDENREEDPKARVVERYLLDGAGGSGPWLNLGCIVFSQYFDSVYWLAERLSDRLPDEPIGIYAGASASGLIRARVFTRMDRETIKEKVRRGELRLIIGTDAASEGLNLQRLGTLINLDLPWNPTRLEQRKGRIQRIGQLRDEVLIANLRYRGSVEDRVHHFLSERLQSIRDLFGQLPDTLEDVWVAIALHDEERAREVIDAVPADHPFVMRYDQVERVDWESCSVVLDSKSQLEALLKGWQVPP